MSETDIINDIRFRLYSDYPAARLFRNNNGRLQDSTGGYVTYGLGPGTSDLIGFLPRVIREVDVGCVVAQFVAIEVKTPQARPRGIKQREHWQRQIDFINAVSRAGGIAGVASTYDGACEILNHSIRLLQLPSDGF